MYHCLHVCTLDNENDTSIYACFDEEVAIELRQRIHKGSAITCFVRVTMVLHSPKVANPQQGLLFGSRQQTGQSPFFHTTINSRPISKRLILFLKKCVYNAIGVSMVLILLTSSAEHLSSPSWSILIDCVEAGTLLLLNNPGDDGQ